MPFSACTKKEAASFRLNFGHGTQQHKEHEGGEGGGEGGGGGGGNRWEAGERR